MRELIEEIREAKTLGELNELILWEEYFSEFKENEYTYYREWFMQLDSKTKYFATISNYLKEVDEEGNYRVFHITTEIVDDVSVIQARIEELEEMRDSDEIDREYFYDEIESIISGIKVKNSRLEEL